MPVDRVVRALWARAIGATLPRPAQGAIGGARRVLLLRHDAIGDMLSSLGLIRTLAEGGLEVDVLASPENAVVLAHNPWGVRVHVSSRTRAARRQMEGTLAARHYDAVIDGLVLKPGVNSRTVRLLRASRAAVRVGTGGRTHDFLYTHPVATDLGANHVEVLAALLAPFGIPAKGALEPVPMPLSDDERAGAAAWWRGAGPGPRLFVNLSASSAERRWPDARFEAVLRTLVARYPALRVLVTGSPADWPAAAAIAGAAGGRVATGGLRAAFALLAASDVVLTPDTSVAHAAAGFQVPSVVLMPEGNLRFAPWRAPGRIVVARGRSLGTVQEAEVTQTVLELLAKEGARR